MCGISAVLSLAGYPAQSNGERLSSLEQLRKSLDLVQHRGPDARGEWTSNDGNVCMCLVLLFKVNNLHLFKILSSLRSGPRSTLHC